MMNWLWLCLECFVSLSFFGFLILPKTIWKREKRKDHILSLDTRIFFFKEFSFRIFLFWFKKHKPNNTKNNQLNNTLNKRYTFSTAWKITCLVTINEFPLCLIWDGSFYTRVFFQNSANCGNFFIHDGYFKPNFTRVFI